MQFTVPVHFTVSARNAHEASSKIAGRLKGHQVGHKYKVQDAVANNVSKIETSEELKEFLESEIEKNEQADLNCCLDSAQEGEVQIELEGLVRLVGGATKAVSLLAQGEKP